MSTTPATPSERPAKEAAISSTGRLESWKEIAGYLNRTVRTARRWEKTEGLPVQRHQHASDSTVYASRAELDAWLAQRRPKNPPPGPRAGAQADPALPPFAADASSYGMVIPRWLVMSVAAGGLGFFLFLLYGVFFRHWTFLIRL